jgi:ArsR family transcriptional regulator
LVDIEDSSLVRDLGRLAKIRAERAKAAGEYFEAIATSWDQMRDLHVADAELENAMVEALGSRRVDDLLDIGTGTGRVLEVFSSRIEHGLGIDLSQQMLNLARTRLHDKGLTHCRVRHGNVYNLDLEPGSIDVAVLHHVLHFLDDPAASIAQAARTLRPDGLLMIADFAPHGYENMREDYAHRWLGFEDDEVATWCEQAGLVNPTATHLVGRSHDGQEALTVTLWTATQHKNAPAIYKMEAAS